MNAIPVLVCNRIHKIFKRLKKRFYKSFLHIGGTFSAAESISVNDSNMDWTVNMSRNHAMIIAFEYDCLFLLENILLSESKNK